MLALVALPNGHGGSVALAISFCNQPRLVGGRRPGLCAVRQFREQGGDDALPSSAVGDEVTWF